MHARSVGGRKGLIYQLPASIISSLPGWQCCRFDYTHTHIHTYTCVWRLIAFVLELGVVRAVAVVRVCVQACCCGLCGSLAARLYAHVVMSWPDRVGQLLKLIGSLC